MFGLSKVLGASGSEGLGCSELLGLRVFRIFEVWR